MSLNNSLCKTSQLQFSHAEMVGADVINRKDGFGHSKRRARKAMTHDVSQPTAKLPSWLERKIKQYLLQIQCDMENETITYIVPRSNTKSNKILSSNYLGSISIPDFILNVFCPGDHVADKPAGPILSNWH